MRKQLVLLVLVCFAIFSCSTDDAKETLLIRMNHHQQTAVGAGKSLVYVVQQDEAIGTAQWSLLHDEIEGFQFEPGYIYDLLVAKEFIGYTLVDGSSVRYTLEKIVRKEKVAADTSFEILLKSVAAIDPPEFVTGNLQTGFEILERIPINCGSLCEELQQVLSTEDEVTGIFRHLEDAEGIELLELKVN